MLRLSAGSLTAGREEMIQLVAGGAITGGPEKGFVFSYAKTVMQKKKKEKMSSATFFLHARCRHSREELRLLMRYKRRMEAA